MRAQTAPHSSPPTFGPGTAFMHMHHAAKANSILLRAFGLAMMSGYALDAKRFLEAGPCWPLGSIGVIRGKMD